MRLLLVCVLLFLAPAGALLVTDRYVAVLEGEFMHDASSQVARLNGIIELYPPRVRKLRSAPAIMQLRGLRDGATVAAVVCGAPDSPFRNLFDSLNRRCNQWALQRRARTSALLAVVLTVGLLALVLMARITVQRYFNSQLWPGNWTLWFVLRGLPLLLIPQIFVSLMGYGIVLKDMTGKMGIAIGALAIPFVILFWIERRLVLRYVEPQSLNVYRPKGVKGPRRQNRFAMP